MIRSYHFLLYTSVPGCLALLFAMAVSYGYVAYLEDLDNE